MKRTLLLLVIIFFWFLLPTQAGNDEIDKLSRFIEANPKSGVAYSNRGHAYARLKQYTKAIQDFDKVIELDPGDAWAYNNRGHAYFALQRIYKGCADYKKACELGDCKGWKIAIKEGRCSRDSSIHISPNDLTPLPNCITSEAVDEDGVYVAYNKGIVRDTKTGLEWKAGPDRDMTWGQARHWVQSLNLDGGGWRMPTKDELETLYKEGAGSRNMTSLLKTTGWFVWSGETKGSSRARHFYFGSGSRPWIFRGYSISERAFAVRSRSEVKVTREGYESYEGPGRR